jgi:hypothetical protein
MSCQVSFAPYKSNFSDWAARGAWRPCLQLLQLPCPFQCLWQTTILTRVQLVCIHLLNAHTQNCKILRTLNSNMCKTYATLTCSHLLPNLLALSITDRLQAWNHIRRKWMKHTWWVHSSRFVDEQSPNAWTHFKREKKREMFCLSRTHISIATPLIAGKKDSNGFLGIQFWL